MTEIGRIESATLTAWPAIKLAHDGLWVWRYAQGYTKRANSIQCLDPSDGDDAGRRLEAMVLLSRRHEIAPVVRVTPLTAPEIVTELDGLGWARFEESLVLAMPMPEEDYPVAVPVRLFDPDDENWRLPQGEMAGYNAYTLDILQRIVSLIPCETCGVLVLTPEGAPAAAALASVADGMAVFVNVIVSPTLRGQGYGRAVMGAALNWARSAGARQAAIQVLADNAPALGLYGALGFAERYRYHYRTPAEQRAP